MRRLGPIAYAGVLAFPVLAAIGLWRGGWWTAVVPVVIFGLLPLLELFLPTSAANPTAEEEARLLADRRFDALLFALVAVQVGLVALLVVRVDDLHGVERIGAILSVGMCCGAVGINVGHELGHRRERLHRAVAKVSLLTSLYVHFFVEHNRGHHSRVATPDDPATARRGETLYAFWVRSIEGSWRSAWHMEIARARRQGRNVLGWGNEVVQAAVLHALAVTAAALAGGPLGAAAFVGAALVGVLMLETVNYIEHYGLVRARTDRGWEKVRPVHSWNSEHALGRVLLFELTRHSDHHAHPHRPYPVLRHFDEAPELPTGYPGMMVLAAVPPLFFRVMHPRVDALAR